MTRCDFRSYGECGCQEGQCVAAAPRQIDIASAPLILFTPADIMRITIAACVALPIFLYFACDRAVSVYHADHLDRQEMIASKR